jgi:NAD-dependent dihydropyrimidine dehydrogenase PreA subunit
MARTRELDTTLRFDEEKCTGCRACTEVCPHAVFRMNGKKARLERPEDCMECGACALNCREGAIFVESGVGCASATILSALRLKKQPRCC